ncbi:MAG: oligosaccharide flippase family protein [Candidatus Omnitrophota bacterium]|nr:oligosaccharide flippase family protein [Candidatus Omnitrophota bacterium]MBU1929362.1 oligosaccharide flippase family protein [Candidatus Omnitrophota bacterium]MBU2035654.1 oligosaccharide flippase family protein [Candidatus Omnitrophota bacterium]MBU2221243.1 oligosaccharide flippase family protein [Candidatus Omnitrophota bacterium]MBU2258680.1 oligosaccharide flippase family protein [Candidatus Omnitrophota bacterium]
MITTGKIAENGSINILGSILDCLINLIISMLLARYFGQAGFGKLSFLAAFIFFLAAADNQWIRPILVREMSRDKNNSPGIIGNGLIIRVMISLCAVILFWIAILIVNPPWDVKILALFASLGLLSAPLISSYETIFQVSLKMKYFVGLNLLNRLLILAVIFMVVILKKGLIAFYILAFIPTIILLFLLKYFSKGIIDPDFKINTALWRMIFKESWPLGISAFFIFVYNRVDQIIILYFRGPQDLGLYAAGLRLKEVLNIIPLALMMPMLPVLSGYFNSSRKDFVKIYQGSFKYLLIFIVPLAVVVSLFPRQILYLFYGSQFSIAGLSLTILIWSEVFVFMGVVNNSILIASNKQIFDPLFTGISALVNIILNLILIPRYGFIGAAISALACCAAGPLTGLFINATREYSYSMIKFSLKPLSASLLAAYLIYCLHLDLQQSILLFPLIYLLIMYLIKGINKDDIILVKSIIIKSR